MESQALQEPSPRLMLVASEEKPSVGRQKGALRDPGGRETPDLGLGVRGRVVEEATFHLTPEGWPGVSSVNVEGRKFPGRETVFAKGPR